MQQPVPEVTDHEPTGPTPIGAPTLRQSGRVLLFAVLYAAVFIGLLVATILGTPASLSDLALLVVLFSGSGAAAGLAVHIHLLRRDGLALGALGFTRPRIGLVHLLWQIPLIVIVVVIVTATVMVVLLQQPPRAADGLDNLMASANVLTWIGVLLAIAVVTPIWEEALFRGLLFSSLTRHVPTSVAAVLSSAVFALIHLAPPAMLYQFLIGLGCCWLYARHRTLWAPIALHVVNNSLVTAIASTA